MEPKTMALLATMTGGAVVSAAGSIMEGQAIADSEKLNAQMAEDEGKEILRSSVSDASDQARQHRRLLARQRVLKGSSGLSGGTFGDVMMESAKNMAIDRQRTVNAGVRGDYMKKVEAAGYKASAKNAKKASYIRATSSLLGGATNGMSLFRE